MRSAGNITDAALDWAISNGTVSPKQVAGYFEIYAARGI
jgi:hypothetical protein